jgi:HlyD family secretion protein
LIAIHQLEEARTQLDQAENRRRVAESQLSIARARVAEASANVAQAQAAVDRAEEELANATIRAPIRGRILARDIEVGSPVSSILNMGAAATSVITMGDISHVFVRGRVDETEIGNLRLGQPARIRVETFKDRTFQGRVTQISPMGVERDNVTNFEVRVSIDNPGNELKANMTANAEIVLEERPNVLIVPEAAITYDATRKASVDVLDKSERMGRRHVPITVGISNGTRTQVLEGLNQGDRVVLPS